MKSYLSFLAGAAAAVSLASISRAAEVEWTPERYIAALRDAKRV